MTVEFDQVTIAISASGLRGPLGRHLFSAFLALDSLPQQLVIVRSSPAATFEVGRYGLIVGPLSNARALELASLTADETYTGLLFWKGIQGQFEDRPLT